jgi:hypothetical protein
MAASASPPSAQPLAGTMPLSAPGAPAVTPPGAVTPAATAAIPQQAAAGGQPGKGPAGSAFRETLWFKKGDVEHMIAEARAKMAAQGAKPGAVEAPEVPVESEVVPVEDRYKDDGSVTTEDRKKFSLRTGGTATAMPTVKPGMVPGDAMTEQDVIREVSAPGAGWCLRWRRSWCSRSWPSSP